MLGKIVAGKNMRVQKAKSDRRVYEGASTQIGEAAIPIHDGILRVGVVDAEYLSRGHRACTD